MEPENHGSLYTRFAKAIAHFSGKPGVFVCAFGIIIVWGVSGPIFGFSDTWQLVINTSTTIITFLMVFLIQNTQNRDTTAIQLKLDELIRVTEGAHNALLDLEELDEEALHQFHKKYEALAQAAREALEKGGNDTGSRGDILDKTAKVPEKKKPTRKRTTTKLKEK